MPALLAPNVAPSGFERGLDTGTAIGGRIINTFDTHKKAEQDRALGEQNIKMNTQKIEQDEMLLQKQRVEQAAFDKQQKFLDSPANRGQIDAMLKDKSIFGQSMQEAVKNSGLVETDEKGDFDLTREITNRRVQEIGKYLTDNPDKVNNILRPKVKSYMESYNSVERKIGEDEKKLSDLSNPKMTAQTPDIEKQKLKLQETLNTNKAALDNMREERDQALQQLSLTDKAIDSKTKFQEFENLGYLGGLSITRQQNYKAGKLANDYPGWVKSDATLAKEELEAVNKFDIRKETSGTAIKVAEIGAASRIKAASMKGSGSADKETDTQRLKEDAKKSVISKGYEPTEINIHKEMAAMKGTKGAKELSPSPSSIPSDIPLKNYKGVWTVGNPKGKSAPVGKPPTPHSIYDYTDPNGKFWKRYNPETEKWEYTNENTTPLSTEEETDTLWGD